MQAQIIWAASLRIAPVENPIPTDRLGHIGTAHMNRPFPLDMLGPFGEAHSDRSLHTQPIQKGDAYI